MSDLTIALAGGAIGSAVTAGLTQLATARAAWSEVGLHDDEARERNVQLLVWVDDRTRALVQEMERCTNSYAASGQLYSGVHGQGLANAKAEALHQFRDEEWRARLDLAHLRTSEGPWHLLWRTLRRRPAPSVTVAEQVEPFLARWREPVSRHGSTPDDAVVPLDRTTRAVRDALEELPNLKLT
jgi:hypothetical protein